MSTSKCWRCGSENLALMRTLELKYCCCGQWMPWRLEPGQKPVGYSKPVAERKDKDRLHNEESKDD